jgi:hypothetical protein
MSSNINQTNRPNYMILLIALGVTAVIVIAVIVVFNFGQQRNAEITVENSYKWKVRQQCLVGSMSIADVDQCMKANGF